MGIFNHGNKFVRSETISPAPWSVHIGQRTYTVTSPRPGYDVIVARIPKIPVGECLHAQRDAAAIAALPELIRQMSWLILNPAEENRAAGRKFLESLGVDVDSMVDFPTPYTSE